MRVQVRTASGKPYCFVLSFSSFILSVAVYMPCEAEFMNFESGQKIIAEICRDGNVDTAGCISKLF